MPLSNKMYEILSYVALVVMPAIVVFYGSLAAAWEWENAPQILASIAAVEGLLGALLKISSYKHNQDTDGLLNIVGYDEDTGIPDMQLVVTRDPMDASKVPAVGKVARLKVRDLTNANPAA